MCASPLWLARELLIYKAYVGVFGRRLFVAAFGSAVWELEFADLEQRERHKKLRSHDGRHARHFEMLLLEQVRRQGVPRAALKGLTSTSCASEIDDVAIRWMLEVDAWTKQHLFKETSAEFNQLCARRTCTSRCLHPRRVP